MLLTEEICGFLSDHGLDCNVGSVGLQTVIHTHTSEGVPATLMPVSQSSLSMEEAYVRAEISGNALRSLVGGSGAHVLVVPEDRWRSQGNMMRLRLLAHLQIFTQVYARNCEVRKIDKGTAARFLRENHSYGDASCRYRYGLFLKRHTGHNIGQTTVAPGTLVAVATFSNARKWLKGDKIIRSYEWTRYASLPQVRLSGGMGKLLKTFIDEVGPDDIMTYADLEWSEGKVYEKLGFVLEGFKEPVSFSIDSDSWQRTALNGGDAAFCGKKCFRNFGSNKYRLKLTDYQ